MDNTAQSLEGNWHPFNKVELSRLLLEHGKSSRAYSSARRPYAVFDWDNTCVFLDVEDATTVYMLDNVDFDATPEAFTGAMRTGLPNDSDLEALAADICESYSWLYLRLRAGGRIEELRGRPHLLNFRAKFVHLYQLFEDRHGPDLAYPWLPFRFTGMTQDRVCEVTRKAVEWQLGQPIERVTWTSPDKLAGRAGVVEASWHSGLRLLPEMQSLFQQLRGAGIDVWICTASFADGIREISSSQDFGYNNPAEHVIGLQLERDAKGRYLPSRLAGSDITYGKGKSQAIGRLLIDHYGHGPILVAGDSNGDATMLADFPTTIISLMIDLGRPADSAIGRLVARARAQRGQPGARYLVQERDERLGCFVP